MNEEENKEQKEQKENDLTEQDKEEKAESLPALVGDLKAQFAKERQELTQKYEGKIKERDEIIKQLMSNPDGVKEEKTIAEQINERRKASLKPW